MDNTATLIEIPADKLTDIVKLVYDWSSPAGLGFLHARDGELDAETLKELIKPDNRIAVRMDYVHGRQCKFVVWHYDGKYYTRPYWPDHGKTMLIELLAAIGVDDPSRKIFDANEAQRLENEKWERENP